MISRLSRIFLVAALLPVAVVAQTLPASQAATPPVQTSVGAKKALTISDYSKWRSIEGAEISPDGKWVAYALRFMNTLPAESKPALHIVNLDSNQDIEVPNAHSPSFSSDSRWVVYQIDSVPARGGRTGGAGSTPPATDTSAAAGAAPQNPGAVAPPQGAGRSGAGVTVPPRMELRELASGRTQSWQRMQSGDFNAVASHLILRRRAAAGPGRGAGPAPAPAPAGPNAVRGTDAVVHDLASGRSLFLGSVGDISFNRQGDLLAYTVDAQVRDGNGLFMIDVRSGRTHVLDNDSLQYNRLTWSDDGNRVAVLKGRPVERMRERDNVLLALSNLRNDDRRSGDCGLEAGALGNRIPEGIRRQRAHTVVVERRREADLPRHHSADIGARYGPPAEYGFHRRRGHLAYGRRAHPVAADDPGRAGAEFHVPAGVRRYRGQVHHPHRFGDAHGGDLARRAMGRRPRYARLHLGLQAPRCGLLSRQYRDRRAHTDDEGAAYPAACVRHLA